MRTNPATKVNPAPSPATARPTRNGAKSVDAPQTPQPNAKSPCPVSKDGNDPERSHHTPARTIPNNWVVNMTENANPYDRTASSSRATSGIAVETAIDSKAMTRMSETSARVRAAYSGPKTPARLGDSTSASAFPRDLTQPRYARPTRAQAAGVSG